MLAQTHSDSSPSNSSLPAAIEARIEARRAGTDGGGPLDLSCERLIRLDLSNLDLAGSDFTGADLSLSDLSGANLLGAKLTGATLFEADLSKAELSGADLCRANLEGADLTYAGLGLAKLEGAILDRADLTGATLSGADLRCARMQLAVLEHARVLEANLEGTDLSRARLAHAELDRCQVAGANFDLADLRSAGLSGMDGYQRASWLGVDLRDIDFTGAYLCRNFILDQNYIQEFRSQSRWAEVVYQIWRLTSDCGRSVMRWAFCTGWLVVAFAWAYTYVAVDYGDHRSALSPIYFSVVTMTTLGFGDVLPASSSGQLVVMAQVITGYVMLGGLLSIFSNKMASRAN